MRQSPTKSAPVEALKVRQAPFWRGHSGRTYAIVRQDFARFALSGHTIFVLADEGRALWVGSEFDLIADGTSRTRFRTALTRCTEVFAVADPLDPEASMSIALDIETGYLAEPEPLDAAG